MRIHITTAAVGMALLLTACSSEGGSSTSEDDNPDGSDLESTELTVGVLPISDYAAVYWAEDQGLFEEAGLDVTLEPVAGGPAGIQSAVSGEIECSFANTIATLVAQDTDVPVTMVALSGALGPETNTVMVAEDSDIQSLEDLDGATIGVNTTNNIGDVAFYNLVDAEGADVEVQFVELPFGEMIDGVQAGSLDATHTPEPFRSAAIEAGLRPVADLTTGPNENMPAAAFVCGTRFVDDHPNTASAFSQALYDAGAEMNANESDLREWLPSIADVPDEVAQSMKLPIFYEQPETSEVARLADLLAVQGLLSDDFDVDASLYQP